MRVSLTGDAVDVGGAGRGVDVQLADVQVSAHTVGAGAAGQRGDGGAQDEVSRVGGEVVVAAVLVGEQCCQLVGGAERDDRLGGVDARVGAAVADLAQQRAGVRGMLEVGEDHDVDEPRGELRDGARGAVGVEDGVPVGVELLGEGCAQGVVRAGDEKGVLLHGGLRSSVTEGLSGSPPALGR